jgi:lanosterol synthase
MFDAAWAPLDLENDKRDKPFTDYSRWRLKVSDGGRHTWHYLHTDEECEQWPQNTIDRYWLGLPTVRTCYL